VALLEWTVEDDYVEEFKKLMGEMYQILNTEMAGQRLTPRDKVKGVVGMEPRAAGKALAPASS